MAKCFFLSYNAFVLSVHFLDGKNAEILYIFLEICAVMDSK